MKTDKEKAEFLKELLGLSEGRLEHIMSCEVCENRFDIGCGCCSNMFPETTCLNYKEDLKK